MRKTPGADKVTRTNIQRCAHTTENSAGMVMSISMKGRDAYIHSVEGGYSMDGPKTPRHYNGDVVGG